MTMYAEERQQAMAQLVAEHGRLSVNVLAEQYDVTTETVRRDLSALERMGLVRRVHGGAVPATPSPSSSPASCERDSANTAEKDRIAKAALDLLPPAGSTVLIDAGSTTSRLASRLPRDHRLVVVTHAVPVAARLAGNPQIELHLLPGRVRATTQAAVGAETVAGTGRAARRRRLPRHQRASPSSTASPPPTATRPPPSAPWSPARARSWSSPTPARSAPRRRSGSPRSARSTSSSPTTAIAAADRRDLAEAGPEVVVA